MAPTRTDTEAEIAAVLESPAFFSGGRQINQDVHSGGHPQAAHERISLDLARAARGAVTRFEDIPKEAGVEQDPNTGDWYRVVRAHTGEQRLVDGVLHNVVRRQRRPIAQTLQDARAANADYWAGSTWIRRGVKPEAEHPANVGAASDATMEEILEPVSATEQLQARTDALTRLAVTPVVPDAAPHMRVEKADKAPRRVTGAAAKAQAAKAEREAASSADKGE
jgi:hypothetical protein